MPLSFTTDPSIGLVPPPSDFSQLVKPCAPETCPRITVLAAWPPLIQTLQAPPRDQFPKIHIGSSACLKGRAAGSWGLGWCYIRVSWLHFDGKFYPNSWSRSKDPLQTLRPMYGGKTVGPDI